MIKRKKRNKPDESWKIRKLITQKIKHNSSQKYISEE